MYRRKTILSAGPILMLIGAAAPAATTAAAAAELRAQSQTAAQAGKPATADEGDQADLLSHPVTLDLIDAPLGSALEAIARRAGLALAYNADALPAGRTITLHVSALPVLEAFMRALAGTGLEPTIMRNGQVTLARQPGLPLGTSKAARPQQAVVTGTVTDAVTGELLRGAEVGVDESERTTVTDAEGRFTIEDVPPGTHTLVASMIGYGDASETVTVAAGATVSVDFTLTVSAVPLDEVVVTGTLVPTQMRAVPSPVAVITAADIEKNGLVRFEDILRSVPGVGVNTTGTGYIADINVRGSSTLGSSSPIKTYIDGVEVSQPTYVLNQIDPATIERVELIRGPQASTLYGSEAIAGVIQIFTKKGRPGTQRPNLQVGLSSGALQSHYKDGLTPLHDHSIGITGGERNVSYSVTGSYRYTGEWVEDELIDELGLDVSNSTRRELGLSAGLKYVAGPITAEALIRVSDWLSWSPQPTPLVDAARSGKIDSPTFTKPNGRETAIAFQTYGITLAYSPSARWQNRFVIGVDGTAWESRRPQPRLTTPADTLLTFQSHDWVRRSFAYNTAVQIGAAGRLSSTLQAGFDLAFEEEFFTSTSDAARLIGGLGNATANLTRNEIADHGIFLQNQTAWRDQLFLTAGLRADKSTGFGDESGYAWSPRVGLSHVLDLGRVTLKSRISAGTAIRAPEPSRKLGQVVGITTTLPNDALKPEKQSGYDLGLELYVGSSLSIGATYYNQEARDLIGLVHISGVSPEPQVVQNQNVGRVRNTGWELEGQIDVGGLTINGQYSWIESTVKELSPSYTGTAFVVGKRPFGVPENTAELSVGYAFPGGSATLTMSHKGAWRQYRYLPFYEALFGTDPDREPYRGSLGAYAGTYPAFQNYDLNARYDLSRHVTALLSIDNLLNGDATERSDYELVRGRQILVGLQFNSDI